MRPVISGTKIFTYFSFAMVMELASNARRMGLRSYTLGCQSLIGYWAFLPTLASRQMVTAGHGNLAKMAIYTVDNDSMLLRNRCPG